MRLSVGCGLAEYPAGGSFPMQNSGKGYEITIACKDGFIERIFIKGQPLPNKVKVCNPSPRCFTAQIKNGYLVKPNGAVLMHGETVIFPVPNLVTPK